MNVELSIFIGILIFSFFMIWKYRDKIKLEIMLGIPLKKPIRIFGRELHKFPLIYAVMIKTKIGLKTTDRIVSKLKNKSKAIGYICIVVGVVCAIYISYLLIDYIITKLTAPSSIDVQAVAFILPFKVKGAIYVPLIYWLLTILIIAVTHEFGHALVARAHNIPVKSTGPAFFGIFIPLIPAAFVEPDEKEIKTRPRKQQLSVYSAGAAFNIITGLLALVLLVFVFFPLTNNLINFDGVNVEEVLSERLDSIGLKEGQVITRVTFGEFSYGIDTREDLANVMLYREPGAEILIETTDALGYHQEYTHLLEENPADPGKAMLGISLSQHESYNKEALQKYGLPIVASVKWLRGLVLWVSLLSIGIGFMNLLPMVPLDGGLMVNSFVCGTKFEKPITFGISGLFLVILILLFII